jgi:AcrR family transcriptional regulator
MSQNATFQPSDKQIKFARFYLDLHENYTQKEIAKKVGTNRKTIWRWFRDREFVSWLNDIAYELLEDALAPVIKRTIKEALKGEFPFCRIILEMTGRYVPNQFKGPIAPTVNLHLVDVRTSQDVKMLTALQEGSDNGGNGRD